MILGTYDLGKIKTATAYRRVHEQKQAFTAMVLVELHYARNPFISYIAKDRAAGVVRIIFRGSNPLGVIRPFGRPVSDN